MTHRIALFLLFVCFLAPVYSEAQLKDTIRLDMQAVQQRFLAKNLQIIANKFNIDIAKALVIQAKTYYNPNIAVDGSVYNNVSRKYFDWGYNGNADGQLTQLFSIAGKHTNSVKLAKVSADEAQLAFDDLMRALYYQLYSDYKNIYYTQQEIDLLSAQEKSLSDLISGTEQMFKLGAIAGNEVFRLKAELNDLENQNVTAWSAMLDLQADLKVMLNYPDTVYLRLQEMKPQVTTPPPYQQVIADAENSRPDVLLAHKNVEFNRMNLKLQKSTAVPDLAWNFNYSHYGSYGLDYTGTGLAIDIPIFNHNQGNIKAARYGINQAQVQDTLQMNTVKNQVATSYVTYLMTKARVDKFDDQYSKDLEELKDFAFQNYKKRTINLLEFLDQLRTYNTAKLSLISLKSSYIDALNDLNFKSGKMYLKY
ncbi:MAG TPA: TolC family protein [Bacteroidia bacterium]|jgi:cobalt-zinc-cadmium efflux system outer membrane protein|nr:TolC family protein [Bacteroidia bacterium]